LDGLKITDFSMAIGKRLWIQSDDKFRLKDIDPASTLNHDSPELAKATIAKHAPELRRLQAALYAESQQSLLIVLQGLDAAGKDGIIGHVFSATNPQGTRVAAFKQPTEQELSHDFLWRVHAQTPAAGEIVIFNRSHYEDVLVPRVHKLVPKDIWQSRYGRICEFERLLTQRGTRIVKFMLHISAQEQLKRFEKRLSDPSRNWKISMSDYSERRYFDAYMSAYEDAIRNTTTAHAPWFVIPADHKWFRDLAVSTILVDTLEGMNIKIPKPKVDLDAIRREFHSASNEQLRAKKPGRGPDELRTSDKHAKID
jgi:PPK2 family polyphosphate:nucleotide phosphotransferase